MHAPSLVKPVGTPFVPRVNERRAVCHFYGTDTLSAVNRKLELRVCDSNQDMAMHYICKLEGLCIVHTRTYFPTPRYQFFLHSG